MTTNNGLRLGTTIYSFTNEYHSRRYTLDQLIAKVAELDLGPGVELVGFSHVRGFPTVTDEFADHLKMLLDQNGLQPSCLGLNADVQIRRDHRMTEDECYDYHVAQVQAAAKLGFPVVRHQLPAGPEVTRRLVPLAERLNVKLGLEIHAPERVDTPSILAFREMYAKVDSPFLGFIPDFGACARAIPPSFTESFRKQGIRDELIALALECWELSGTLQERIGEYRKREKAAGATDFEIGRMTVIFSVLARMDPRAWLEIMPQVVHIHGKCYDFDENGDEVAIPYGDILPLFRDSGYSGFMSTEWEGHASSDEDGIPKVQAHHVLCKRILGMA
jgi:sugar phosphate isomerase/epimerase